MTQQFPWKNPENRKKAEDLVAKMSIEEAASQLLHSAPAVERLDVPAYNWWSEALHGVARAGIATVFPQAIGLAAMWDDAYLQEIADIISTEARAKYNAAIEQGDRDIYKGLTFWSPNINIFRDPRWGRGHETYGEDPFLTARCGVAFIKGLQGDGAYLKVAACAKHFAVHSGPEALRHEFNAVVSEKDLNETYLPAFRAAVQEAGVESVMGAYNRTNGEPCCGSEKLLVGTLREKWNFDGHVVSDCWAVKDFHEHHHYTNEPKESASLAVSKGCDLNCGCTYEHLLEGLEAGLVSEKAIRESATRLMQTRARLGILNVQSTNEQNQTAQGQTMQTVGVQNEYDKIPYTVVHQKSHQAAALKAAEESICLLKNDGLLPLDIEKIKTIGVIGPNAYCREALFGNYNGDSDHWVTNLDGIRECMEQHEIRTLYSQGCHLWMEQEDGLAKPGKYISEALTVAKYSDVVVLCVGLDGRLEGEEGDAGNSDASGDKQDLLLPKSQQILCEKVLATGKPVVLVMNCGSSIDLSAYESRCNAILQCWYSGEKGGQALAEVLTGEKSPAGRLSVTFYYNDNTLPEFTDYAMKNRTYRYYQDPVWYPFGYGLGYSKMKYSELKVNFQSGTEIDGGGAEGAEIDVMVKNCGAIDSDEVVECYIRYEGEHVEKPLYSLCGFKRIHLAAGESRAVSMYITQEAFSTVFEDGSSKILPGEYTIFVGGSAPDERSVRLTGQEPLRALVKIS